MLIALYPEESQDVVDGELITTGLYRIFYMHAVDPTSELVPTA